jgi:hypothetical protein
VVLGTCPTGDGGSVNQINDVGGFIAELLTGKFITDGAKALAAGAQGATSRWEWGQCTVCHRKLVYCDNCHWIWLAETTPSAGDLVVCPHCHSKLI